MFGLPKTQHVLYIYRYTFLSRNEYSAFTGNHKDETLQGPVPGPAALAWDPLRPPKPPLRKPPRKRFPTLSSHRTGRVPKASLKDLQSLAVTPELARDDGWVGLGQTTSRRGRDWEHCWVLLEEGGWISWCDPGHIKIVIVGILVTTYIYIYIYTLDVQYIHTGLLDSSNSCIRP